MRENPGALGFFGEVGPVGGASRRTDAIVRIAFATGRRLGSSLALTRETAMGGCVFFFLRVGRTAASRRSLLRGGGRGRSPVYYMEMTRFKRRVPESWRW